MFFPQRLPSSAFRIRSGTRPKRPADRTIPAGTTGPPANISRRRASQQIGKSAPASIATSRSMFERELPAMLLYFPVYSYGVDYACKVCRPPRSSNQRTVSTASPTGSWSLGASLSKRRADRRTVKMPTFEQVASRSSGPGWRSWKVICSLTSLLAALRTREPAAFHDRRTPDLVPPNVPRAWTFTRQQAETAARLIALDLVRSKWRSAWERKARREYQPTRSSTRNEP